MQIYLIVLVGLFQLNLELVLGGLQRRQLGLVGLQLLLQLGFGGREVLEVALRAAELYALGLDLDLEVGQG